MTETQRVLRLLARRVAATKLYEVDSPTDEPFICVHLEDAIVLIQVVEDAGEVREALSYVSRHMSLTALHLNQWFRPPGRMSPPAIVTDIWRAFWEHEVENREHGRVQWMCGPELPLLEEDVPVQQHLDFTPPPVEDPVARAAEDLAEFLDSILSDPPAPPPPKPIIDIREVLDLFE